jgi:hypothetical protein
MDCIIARTAAKLASYNWPSQMSTDPERVECTLQNDSRLVAGATAIISHAAREANLASDVQANLAATVAKTCATIFRCCDPTSRSLSTIWFEVESWPDHIEVTLEFAGESLRDFMSDNGSKPPDVDRVNCQTANGRSRLTLIKYSRSAPPVPKP